MRDVSLAGLTIPLSNGARICGVSAEGAKYDSQGQVPTLSGRRPWIEKIKSKGALKVRNIIDDYSALSELHALLFYLPRGDAPRFARDLPLATISRAFGATVAAVLESSSRRV
jgi:hypothetical protein